MLGTCREQAVRAVLAKERRPCNTSLKFDSLHRKRRCKMLIGGDDISNNVITPWYVYIRARFPFALICGKSDSSVDGESHGRIGCGIQIRDL